MRNEFSGSSPIFRKVLHPGVLQGKPKVFMGTSNVDSTIVTARPYCTGWLNGVTNNVGLQHVLHKLPGGTRMNSKSILAGFAILFVTPFGQQSLRRDRNPNDMLTFHGGTGSLLLPLCDAALKMGVGGTRTIKPTATEIQEVADGLYCRGYVLGVVDSLISVSATTDTTYCIPNNADNEQLVRVVDKYLNDNPAKLNEPAIGVIINSMVAAFPCK